MFIFGGKDGQQQIYNDLIVFSVQNTTYFTYRWKLVSFTEGIIPRMRSLDTYSQQPRSTITQPSSTTA